MQLTVAFIILILKTGQHQLHVLNIYNILPLSSVYRPPFSSPIQ
ncbi:hypothetical protein [uncultured Gammaproteobacteria bacterium]|nr:hypothetical protein [uncultured Gammaproteobacteria bacterium]